MEASWEQEYPFLKALSMAFSDGLFFYLCSKMN
jgi:hypothetical protein